MKFKFSSATSFFLGFMLSSILFETVTHNYDIIPLKILIGFILAVIYGFFVDYIWGRK